MNKNILTIMKKELIRFFKDRRMVLSVLLLPGIMIYVMYSFMGDAITNMYTVGEDYKPAIYAVNLPASIEAITKAQKIEITKTEEKDSEAIKKKLTDSEIDLFVVFPADFDKLFIEYNPNSSANIPNVDIFYNTSKTESQTAYNLMTTLLNEYENSKVNVFNINKSDKNYDLASEHDLAGSIFASMMPMLLLIFLFSACMSVAPESIAGEKERGTIATLLVTPVKRGELAMGKIFALSIIALLSGLSSTTGTLISLPKLMGGASDGMNVNIYQTSDYVLLGIIILSTVLLLICMISIISAFAKTVKEATTAVMPLMIVVMLIGITAMFGSGPKGELYYYLIPLYNTVQSMVGIFSFEINYTYILVTVVSNIVYTGIGTFILTKMFNSESIIFSK